MDEKIKQLRKLIHQLSNDFSGVKALVDLHVMGVKKEIDMERLKGGLDKVNDTIAHVKDILRSD